MNSLVLLPLLFSLWWLRYVANCAPKSCSTIITYPDIVPTKGEPVYLIRAKNGNQHVFHPQGRETKLRPGDSLQFYCPKEETIKTAAPSCRSSGEVSKEKKFSCASKVGSEVKETRETCGGGTGKLYNVTLPMPDNQFHVIYSTCFDKKALGPIYSFHILHGKSMGHHVKQERSSFKTGKNIYNKTDINNLYKNHIKKFTNFFGKKQKLFQTPLNFLARGHLTPEVDFALGTEQHATEFYINTAPQFQAINQGNWLRVEKHVRNLAEKLQDDLTVITGVLGILQFPNKNNKDQMEKIFLGNGVIPVPEMFWKIVLHEKKLSSIVFVGSNNPHADSFSPICPDICRETIFGDGEENRRQNFSDGKLGFVICCRLQDFLGKSKVILPENVMKKNYKNILGN